MKFRCYEEGHGARFADYDAFHPQHAAERFAAGFCEAEEAPVNVVVTPADEEAKARKGWRSDDDEPQFRMFTVRASVAWSASEVSTFNGDHG